MTFLPRCFAAAVLTLGLAYAQAETSSTRPTDINLVDTFADGLPTGTDQDGVTLGFLTFQDPGSTVAIATIVPPEAVPGSGEESPALELTLDVSAYAGVLHAFQSAAGDRWEPQDWSGYEGLGFWFYGAGSGTELFVDILDNRNAGSSRDDAERFVASLRDDTPGWRYVTLPFADFSRKDIGNGAPNDGLGLTEVHGWAFGALNTGGERRYYLAQVGVYGTAPLRPLDVSFANSRYDIPEGNTGDIAVHLSRPLGDGDPERVTVAYRTEGGTARPDRAYQPAEGTLTFVRGGETEQRFTLTTLADGKYRGDERIALRLLDPQGAAPGLFMQASAFVLDAETHDPWLLDDFERGAYLWTADGATLEVLELSQDDALALPGQPPYEHVLAVSPDGPSALVARDFAAAQDWSGAEALEFWYYGAGDGRAVTVQLKGSRAPEPGPSGWELVWSDEFDDPAGTPPNPANWSYEYGDVTPDGKNGWGNDELQYYTDDPANVATDGEGNLVITVREADGSLQCYYGPCRYTSARLLSWHKAEFAYGRIEARIQVPQGAGLWPAFWSLGTDIDRVSWPQSGEIDIMEFVGRLPTEVYGTIHGPGYEGGRSFGRAYDLGQPVYDGFHTFAVEWQPNHIVWYIDDVQYHEATPADVAPNAWVFEHPFFLLLNVAVGGNFGGPVGADTTFPQSMTVDYVRVYQAADTAERFQATFLDATRGWQRVSLPLADFTRGAQQPSGAPEVGLELREVWGYGFSVPDAAPFYLDQVQLR